MKVISRVSVLNVVGRVPDDTIQWETGSIQDITVSRFCAIESNEVPRQKIILMIPKYQADSRGSCVESGTLPSLLKRIRLGIPSYCGVRYIS